MQREGESVHARGRPAALAVYLLELALVGGSYYLAARLSLQLALVEENVTPLWPPTGIALVAFLWFGYRSWPAVAVAAFFVNLTISPSAAPAAGIAAGNTLAPLVAAFLLRRVGFRTQLDRLRDALAIVFLASLPSTLISATLGAGSLVLSDAVPRAAFLETASVWWTGDAMGMLLVAPLLLTLSSIRFPPRVRWGRLAEAVALFAVLGGGSLSILWTARPFWVLLFPVLGLVAWRFRQVGAVPAAVLVSSVATAAAVEGLGPFAEGDLLVKMLTLQAFNAAVAFTSLFLSTIVAERQRAQAELQRAATELEDTVQVRTAELTATNDRLAREIAERAETQRALEQREMQLADAQEVARVGSWEWDIEANRVTWSDELYRIYGLDPEVFGGTYDAFLQRVHPDDRERVDQIVRAAFRDHAPFTIYHQIVRPDGTEKTIDTRGRVVLDAVGEPVRMVGTGQDVTEQKRGEAALRVSEERYRTLVEHAPEAIVVFDVDIGCFVEANAEAERLFQMSRDDLFRIGLVEISPPSQPDGRPSVDAAMEGIDLALAGQTPQFEWMHRTSTGEPVLCEVRLLRLPAGSRRLVRGSIIDIRERVRAQKALRESEETFRALFESAVVGIAQCDLIGRVLKTNPAFEQLLGYGPGALAGESLFELVEPKDRDRTHDLFDRMVRGAIASFEIEKRLRRADGARVWVHGSNSLVRDAEGLPRFVHLVVQDISARRRAEALQRAEEERARLHEVFAQVPAPVIVTRGSQHMIEFANAAFIDTFGAGDCIGKPAGDVLPKRAGRGYIELLDEVFSGGRAERADEVPVTLEHPDPPSEERFFDLAFQPMLAPDGEVEGVLAHGVDVTEAVRARRQVTESLAFLDTLVTTAPAGFAVLDNDLRYLRVNQRLAEMNGLPIQAHIGRTVRQVLPQLADAMESDVRRVLETGKPIIDAEVSGETMAAPGMERHWLASYYPVLAPGGERLGVGIVAVEFTERKRFERLLSRQGEVLELIARGGALLPVLEALARLAEDLTTPDVRASILLVDEDGRRLRHGAAPSIPQAFNRAFEGVEIGPTVGSCGAAAYLGESVFVPDITVSPNWEAFRDVALTHGLRAAWSSPILSTDASAIGAFCMYSTQPRGPSTQELELMEVLTHTAAIAIERDRTDRERVRLLDRERSAQAQLYQKEHRIAETLQRSLLPDRLPENPHVGVAARYIPARAEVEVGGDWYDIIVLPDGRFALAIGDVAGHGVPAASAMGQMRMALRAYALEGLSPAGALSRLNRLLNELQPDAMATLLYIHLDPETGDLTFANAGHPPALIYQDGATSYLEGGLSPPLGVAMHIDYRESVGRLESGATLLLYTDGLIEKRRSPIEEGFERLQDLAVGAPEDLEAACDHILGGLLQEEAADDVALLAVRRISFAGQRLRLNRPALPKAIPEVRHILRRWLVENGTDEEDSMEVLLAAGEALTNVIQHAYGPEGGTLDIDAQAKADEISIIVRDRGAWRPPQSGTSEGGRGLQLMHELMDSVEVSSGMNGTEVRMRRRTKARVAR